MANESATRREFIVTSAAGLAAVGLASGVSAEPTLTPDALTDTHVYLGRWPFGGLHRDEPASLVDSLRASGVTQAWAGSFEALLHKDVAGVNARLAEVCRRRGDGMLVPFGAVNPTLPDWEDDLRRCDEDHAMPGIRLHPLWHGYDLADERFGRLVRLATQRRLIVQVECESVNLRRPYLKLPRRPLDLAPLKGCLAQAPGIRVVLLADDWSRRLDKALELAAISGVYLGQRRTGATLGKVAREVSAGPLLLASAAPLHPPRSVQQAFESSGLSDSQQRLIAHGTASELRASAANAP